MTYNRTNWKDRIVEHPRKIKLKKSDGSVEVVDYEPQPGIIEEAGTPVNAHNMNNIEMGIDKALVGADKALVGVDNALAGVDKALVGVDNALIGLGPVGDLSSSKGDGIVTISYTDPTDVFAQDSNTNNIILSEWLGTKIVRKEGEYPSSIEDGVIVSDSQVRDEYSTSGFVDSGLSNYVEYFYMLFPYTKSGKTVYNESNRISVTPTPYTSDLTYGVTGVTKSEDDGEITLTWNNPTDADFQGVLIRRSTTSYPSDIDEGTLVYDGNLETVTDVGLVNDVDYYYTLWAYNTSNQFSDSSNVINIIVTPTEQKIYGIEIDEDNSNPETSVTYADSALGMIPASGNDGNFTWGSWEDVIKNEFGIKPCVLGNPTMDVNYYLNYNDLTKKENNTASVLDGTDGDVMTEFSKPLYWSFSKLDGKISVRLSASPFEGGRRYAFDTESGYNQLHIYHNTLLQILYLLMFKSLDSQTALGRGYVDGNTQYTNTGVTNTKSFCFGESSGKVNMKFLGIEDLWGNRRQWNDGCFYDTDRNILIGLSNFNDEATGYTNMGHSGPSSDSAGYINSVQGGDTTGFIPRLMSGSATTSYCDYGDLYAGRVPASGGALSGASYAGAFYLNSHTVSTANATIGGRLVAKKGDKLYVGAYLGASSGGKLRSISGQVSHNNARIDAFRTLAHANNV